MWALAHSYGRKMLGRLRVILGRLPGSGLAFYVMALAGLGREFVCVCAGLRRMGRRDPEAVLYRLRRNVHRLEKGLCMPRRKSRFALGYIRQTVSDLELVVGQLLPSKPEFQADVQWAIDVLHEFFSATDTDAVLEAAREHFLRIYRAVSLPSGQAVTLTVERRRRPAADFDLLTAIAKGRKSVRDFLPQKVERQLIDRAIELARNAPSGCNRQPFRYLVVDDPQLVSRCVSSLIGISGEPGPIPALVFLVGRWRAFEHPRDRHLAFIDAGLSAMLFLLALEAQGLASCCVNCPDIGSSAARLVRILQLRPDERPVLAVMLGYAAPGAKVGRADRRSLEALREFVEGCS